MKADPDILQKVREYTRRGMYLLAKHAIERQKERGIKLPDVLFVLAKGRHEKEKDSFDVKNQCWKYAIRGKTINGDDLRVIVVFQQKMVIITVIRIKR